MDTIQKFLLMVIVGFLLPVFTWAQSLGKPNIVLIVGDDHDRTAAGCYGNPQIKTPNLDALAAEGVRFTRAYATTSSCSPSRSVLLSGRHNHNNGQYGLQQATHHFHSFEGMKTLTHFLSGGGYRTARAGKFHLEPTSTYPFDVRIDDNGNNPVRMAEKCADFLESTKNQPFFLYFCPTDPHRTGFRRDLPLQPNAHGNRTNGQEGVIETLYGADSLRVPYFLPNTPESRAELAQYYQSVSRLDQGVGKLMAQLKQKGLWEKTIVIYVSDNGMPVPGAKTTHYEPGVRLPLIVRNPFSNQKNKTCDELVSWVDMAPTIVDFAGVPTPSQPGRGTSLRNANEAPGPTAYLHGKSWKAVFDHPGSFRSDTLFLSHSFHGLTQYYPMRTIVTRHYKLIWNIAHPLEFPYASDLWDSATWQAFLKSGQTTFGVREVKDYKHRPAFELYDLTQDPQELVNLANDPKHKPVFDKLLTTLKESQRKTGDPWSGKWVHE
ncbi:sulfatase family protein [Larkinella punicea]|nr:sulfatase [Larkinella punicea]